MQKEIFSDKYIDRFTRIIVPEKPINNQITIEPYPILPSV